MIPSPAAIANAVFNAIGTPHERSADHARQDSGGARMKTFANANARDAPAGGCAAPGRAQGRTSTRRSPAAAAICWRSSRNASSQPDVIVSLKTIRATRIRSTPAAGGVTIGGQITLDALSRHAVIRQQYAVLAEAAEQRRDAADPQRRHARRQRLPAAVVLVLPQRFPVLTRPAAISASRSRARTSSTRSSAAGRATSSIRRTRRRRSSRWTRRSASSDRPASGECRRRISSCCRGRTPQHENVLAERRSAGVGRRCRRRQPGTRSTYTRCSTAKRGRTRSSAPPSCSRWTRQVCRRAQRRARRRGADSVAAAGSGEDARRPADH